MLGLGYRKIRKIMSKIQYLKDILGGRMKIQSYHRHLRFDRVKLFSIRV